ncbi:MAG: hypothetical protein ABJB05_07525 [Parafilimonas sp.]
MKNIKKLFTKYVIAFIVITGFQCAAAAVAPIFVALIGAKTWVDKSALPDDHHFNFIVDTPDSNYSKFEGNEHTINNTLHFTGSYTNHDIQFTYDDDALEDRAGKTYKGTVNDASDEMTLKGTDATDPLPAVTLNYP